MFLKVETAEGNGDEVLRECVIEKALVKEAKSRGGMAVKFVSPGFDGVPDRLVLLPGGKCAFVELKAPGKSCDRYRQNENISWKPWGFPYM